jgi:hypothetical protein
VNTSQNPNPAVGTVVQAPTGSASPLIQPDRSVNRVLLIKHNKSAIMDALRKQSVKSAVAEYSGNGDSGNTTTICINPEESDSILLDQVSIKVESSSFDAESRIWSHNVVDKVLSLEGAIEDFIDLVIEQNGHEGYENGDGGGGDVTFDVEADTVTHDHYDNIVEQNHYSHDC